MLAELQRDFARAVRGDALAIPRIGVDPTGINADRRLAVYRNHHRISLSAALAANFPTVVKVVGEEAFQALTLSYLAFDPPRGDFSWMEYLANAGWCLDRDALIRGVYAALDAVRGRRSLRKTDLIQAPQHPPPTNEVCQYTPHGFATDLRSRTAHRVGVAAWRIRVKVRPTRIG